MQIDLGSVAKGCIGQEIADFFREKGVESGLSELCFLGLKKDDAQKIIEKIWKGEN